MASINYAALRIALNRVDASKKVDAIISRCSSFKIGKTGDTLYERLNNYDGEYNHIESVFKGVELEVDEMESYLIDKYKNHPKCNNIKVGSASYNDSMAEDAEMYHIYVVWN